MTKISPYPYFTVPPQGSFLPGQARRLLSLRDRMTGNTSGPHLHFEVTNDSNNNASFTDEFPHGRTDPFGWLNNELKDPWHNYIWQDNGGDHNGVLSKYLWLLDIPQLRVLITPNQQNSLTVDNKNFDLSELTDLQPYNFDYFAYTFPHVSPSQQSLRYIPKTSFVLNIYNTLKKKIENLPGNIYLTVILDPQSLTGVQKNTLRLYYFDELTKLWSPFLSYFNNENVTVTTQITHLSRFAVFADATDITPPATNIVVTGEVVNGWYSQTPIITLSAEQSDLDQMFYSLDNGATWEEYSQPFSISADGVTTLKYRGVDISGNYEEPKTQTLKINTRGKLTDKVRIIDSTFQIL